MINWGYPVITQYAYDARGRVIYSNGSMCDINPIRYRGYYYDTETGLHYLQSRYYDPLVKQFINPDEFTIAIADNASPSSKNLFAYCGNNPINFYDVEGCYPSAVQDKIVHDAVLRNICAHDSSLSYQKTCVYYNGSDCWDGWGFCDLYNTQTGEVWELKKASYTGSCSSYAAQTQLNNYLKGRLKYAPALELKIPNQTIIPKRTFEFSDGLNKYHVIYWYEGDGILRYKYQSKKTKAGEALSVIAYLGLAAAKAYYNSKAEQFGYVPLPI